MTRTVGRSGTISASPRHMRKRRFLGDIPASRLPDNRLIPHSLPSGSVGASAQAALTKEAIPRPPLAKRLPGSKKATVRQKRLVALTAVIFVSLSIPFLVLTLMFPG